jgi:hypothetical protein
MFTVVSQTSWADLKELIRRTPLLHERGGQIIYPYKDAEISLKAVLYKEVRPTSLYVIRGNLKLLTQLMHDIGPEYDPLQLSGSLLVQDAAGNQVGLIPPIVEQTAEAGQYIVDGMHRAYLGREQGRTSFIAIHISHIRPDCPCAALPNNWEDMISYDDVPQDPQLKRRYRPKPLSLRRDFSSLNGSITREP